MKKLMIIAVIALASTLTQAASFNWQTSSKTWGLPKASLDAGLAAGQTYGVGSANADTMSNQISSYSASWAYTLTLNDGTDTDVLTGSLVSGSFSSRSVNLDLSSSIVDPGKDLTYSIVFTGTITDGKGATFDVTSNEITGSWHVNDIGAIGLSTAAPSSWSTAGVPEPTSGILMLVGLGALALRRRKA